MEVPVENPAAGNVSRDVALEDLWTGDRRSGQEIPDNSLIADLFSSVRNGSKQTASVDSESHRESVADSDSCQLVIDMDTEDSSDNSLSVSCQNSVSTELPSLEENHNYESTAIGKRRNIKREAVNVESGCASGSSSNVDMHGDRFSDSSDPRSDDSVVEIGRSGQIYNVDAVSRILRSDQSTNRHFHNMLVDCKRVCVVALGSNQDLEGKCSDNFAKDNGYLSSKAVVPNDDVSYDSSSSGGSKDDVTILEDDRDEQPVDRLRATTITLPDVSRIQDESVERDVTERSYPKRSAEPPLIDLTDVSSGSVEPESDDIVVLYEKFAPKEQQRNNKKDDANGAYVASMERVVTMVKTEGELLCEVEHIARSSQNTEDMLSNLIEIIGSDSGVDEADETTVVDVGTNGTGQSDQLAALTDGDSNSDLIKETELEENKKSPVSVFRINKTIVDAPKTEEVSSSSSDGGEDFLVQLLEDLLSDDFEMNNENKQEEENDLETKAFARTVNHSDESTNTDCGDKLIYEKVFVETKAEDYVQDSGVNSDVEGQLIDEDELLQSSECGESTDDLENLFMDSDNIADEELASGVDSTTENNSCMDASGSVKVAELELSALGTCPVDDAKIKDNIVDKELASGADSKIKNASVLDKVAKLELSALGTCLVDDAKIKDNIVDEELASGADSTIKNDYCVDASVLDKVAELELSALGTCLVDDAKIKDNIVDEELASGADSTIKNDYCVDASVPVKVAELELSALGTCLVDDDNIEDNFDDITNIFNSTFKCNPCLDSSVRGGELDVSGIDVENPHVDDNKTAVAVDMVDLEQLLLNDATVVDKVEGNSQLSVSVDKESVVNLQNDVANARFDEEPSLIFEESFSEFPLSKSLYRFQSQKAPYLYEDSFQSKSRNDSKMDADNVAGNNLKVCTMELMKPRAEVASEDEDYVDLIGDVSALDYFGSPPARLAPPGISLQASSSSDGEYLDARDKKTSSSDGEFYDCCEPHDLTLEQEDDLLRSDEETDRKNVGQTDSVEVVDNRVFVFTGKKRTLKDCDEESSRKKSRWVPSFSVIQSAPVTEAQVKPPPISNDKTDLEHTNGTVDASVRRDVTRDYETAESKATSANESAPNAGSCIVSETNSLTIPNVQTNSDSQTCSCQDTTSRFGYFCVRCNLPTEVRADDSASRCSSGLDSPDEELDMLFDCNSTLPCTVDMSICSLDQSNVIETETVEISNTKKMRVNDNNPPNAPSFSDTQNCKLEINSDGTATSTQVAKQVKKAFPEAHPDYKSLTLATDNKSIPVALNDVAPSSSRYVDYVSPDAAENEDNNSAGWETFRALQTDEERFLKVRSRWLNATFPDPNRDLTLRHDRKKPNPDDPLLKRFPVGPVNVPFQSSNNPSNTNNKNLVANNVSDFNHNTLNSVNRNHSVDPNAGFVFLIGSQNQFRFLSGPGCLSPDRPAPLNVSFHTDQFPSNFSGEFYTSPVALPQPIGPPWAAGSSQGIDYRYPMDFNANSPSHQLYTNSHPTYLDPQMNPNNLVYHHPNSQLASYHDAFSSPAPSLPASCRDPCPPDAAVERRGVKRALETDEGTECPPLKRARTIPCTKIYDNVLDNAESEQQKKLLAHHSERDHVFEQLRCNQKAEVFNLLHSNADLYQKSIAMEMLRDRQLEELEAMTAECDRREAAIMKQFENKFASVYSAVEELQAFRSFYQNASNSADCYYMNERELAETKEMYDYYNDMRKFYGASTS